MNIQYPALGLLILFISVLLIHSCDLNSATSSDKDLLIGDWRTTSFQVDDKENLNTIFESVDMQYDRAGSSVWLFTDLDGKTESVSGKFEVETGNLNSVLKFIDPEFSMVINDTLYLSGISGSNAQYFIKAVKY
ncbi:hypothetical protein [Portibacter lacus]|uniref:Lipocalin-like domain-containing protein n=1 Tax=Portibacter lacus TaxID=1099794 RepID=A0AA37SN52_9BACT|nr:hypothetical protein [Portibacter lacus]GLR16116.1 hypothetical protein GCM10007940_07310 [Portibacter lacus]